MIDMTVYISGTCIRVRSHRQCGTVHRLIRHHRTAYGNQPEFVSREVHRGTNVLQPISTVQDHEGPVWTMQGYATQIPCTLLVQGEGDEVRYKRLYETVDEGSDVRVPSFRDWSKQLGIWQFNQRVVHETDTYAPAILYINDRHTDHIWGNEQGRTEVVQHYAAKESLIRQIGSSAAAYSKCEACHAFQPNGKYSTCKFQGPWRQSCSLVPGMIWYKEQRNGKSV